MNFNRKLNDAANRLTIDLNDARPLNPQDLVEMALARWEDGKSFSSQEVARWVAHEFIPLCKTCMESIESRKKVSPKAKDDQYDDFTLLLMDTVRKFTRTIDPNWIVENHGRQKLEDIVESVEMIDEILSPEAD